ncbi:hypothetical protein ABZ864_05960 [Streptomyces sp. NPDC047082]|uniref:hypothetical protein n=1 Tax=Streptomyces sp. NPDC047082 TaxID=3155259 RepID=UPI0033D3C126
MRRIGNHGDCPLANLILPIDSKIIFVYKEPVREMIEATKMRYESVRHHRKERKELVKAGVVFERDSLLRRWKKWRRWKKGAGAGRDGPAAP